MDLFETIKMDFLEIMEEYEWCINFLMHYWYPPFIRNNL